MLDCKYEALRHTPHIRAEKIKITGEKLLAQAISHEIDHLNGEVFIDKIIPGTLEIIRQEN